MQSLIVIACAGVAVGVLYGMFGVGSAFATPVLALLGVPGIAAVAAPLPGLLPGSAAGAWSRRHDLDRRVARLTAIGGVPSAVLGAISSRWVGGPILLTASGVLLFAVGFKVIRPASPLADTRRSVERRNSDRFVLAAAAAVGFTSGLLANGGGFLLVPLFLVVLGLDLNEAAGTSMAAATLLTLPTLITHTALGHIDWPVAVAFGAGLVPAAYAGATLAQRLPVHRMRTAFGALVLIFAVWFTVRELIALV